MSKEARIAKIVIFCSGLVVGVAGIIFLGAGTGQPTTPAANGQDKKPPVKTSYHLTERTPAKECQFPAGFGSIYVERDVYPSGESNYYVVLAAPFVGPSEKLAIADVDALVKLANQLKGKKKAEAKEVSTAVVIWKFNNHLKGEASSFSCSLNEGRWGTEMLGAFDPFDEQFIPILEQALRDAEALKAIKPSVSW